MPDTQSEVLILGGARTPMGEFIGPLKDLSAIDLGVIAARAAMERTHVDPAWIDHVVFGNVMQTSGDALSVNYGTIYPALLTLEQEGYVTSAWGASENNRRAKFYALTRAGRKQLAREASEWERTAGIIARFFSPKASS